LGPPALALLFFVDVGTVLRQRFNIGNKKELNKFGLKETLNYAHPYLSRLAFIHQSEGMLSDWLIQLEKGCGYPDCVQ